MSSVTVSGYVLGYNDKSKDVILKDNYRQDGLAETLHYKIEHKDGVRSFFDRKRFLGHSIDIINNCNVSIYITKDRCTLEDAKKALRYKLEGAFWEQHFLVGWSEYTITGYSISQCTIGNHKLLDIIDQYRGLYAIVHLEW